MFSEKQTNDCASAKGSFKFSNLPTRLILIFALSKLSEDDLNSEIYNLKLFLQ